MRREKSEKCSKIYPFHYQKDTMKNSERKLIDKKKTEKQPLTRMANEEKKRVNGRHKVKRERRETTSGDGN